MKREQERKPEIQGKSSNVTKAKAERIMSQRGKISIGKKEER